MFDEEQHYADWDSFIGAANVILDEHLPIAVAGCPGHLCVYGRPVYPPGYSLPPQEYDSPQIVAEAVRDVLHRFSEGKIAVTVYAGYSHWQFSWHYNRGSIRLSETKPHEH